jgi:hypothetical protein
VQAAVTGAGARRREDVAEVEMGVDERGGEEAVVRV